MTFLNQEEKDLLESIENDEWMSIENFSQEKQRYQGYAREQIAQKGIEFILSAEDTQKIQNLANQLHQSIPSVTRDILHKYLQGELIERTSFSE
jgi:predicted DNA binding CopG/RHH family protein